MPSTTFAEWGESVSVLAGLIAGVDIDLGRAGAGSCHRIGEGTAHVACAHGIIGKPLVSPDRRDRRPARNAELREATIDYTVEAGIIVEARLDQMIKPIGSAGS